MSIEFVLKDLIPFGSAFLGTITGGSITYSLSRAKEKKEEIKKRYEAMYEIQSINYKIIGRFKSLEGILQTYILSPVVMEQSTVTDKIQECLNKWAELYVLTLANAKLGFNLPTRTASEVVIDQSGIEHLPSIPRRAIYMKENFTVLVLL